MKKKLISRNTILYSLLSIYVIVVFVCAIMLINFPVDIMKSAGYTDFSKINLGKSGAWPVYLVLIGEFVLSLVIIFLLMTQDRDEKVIYVELNEQSRVEQEEQKISVDQLIEESLASLEDVMGANSALENPQMPLSIILSHICKSLNAGVGALFLAKYEQDKRWLEMEAGYAFQQPDSKRLVFEFGEGISGQCAKEGRFVVINNVPKGYIKVFSGLGAAAPEHMIVFPYMRENRVVAVVEVATFELIAAHVPKFMEAFAPAIFKYVEK